MKYYNMTNEELLNAYNENAEYDNDMCREICARVGMYEDYYYAEPENIDQVMEEAIKNLEASC